MATGTTGCGCAALTYVEKTMSTDNYYRQLLEKKREGGCEIHDKVEKTPVQTGSNTFTQKQWDSFLKDYDELTEYAREEMRIRHEKQYEKQIEREERAREAVMEDYLEVVQEAKRYRAKELQEQKQKEYYEQQEYYEQKE